MAWCPQCKNEYREGVKICSDCGCDLVEAEQYDDLVPLSFGDEEKLNFLKKYLEYNKLQGVTVKFDSEESVYKLYVREDDKGPATAMARVFYQQEALRELEKAQNAELNEEMMPDSDEEADEEQEASENADSVVPMVYQNSSERAEENRSSAWTLLIIGGIGLVAMILGMLGVLPLRLGNPYMFYGVMSAVFILFIVMGVVSMKNAKIFAKKAESENTLRDAMTKWYQENLNAEAVDAALVNGGESLEDVPEEILYFRRIQQLKYMFNHQFMNLDQVFLEHFIDEEVYEFVFPDEEM